MTAPAAHGYPARPCSESCKAAIRSGDGIWAGGHRDVVGLRQHCEIHKPAYGGSECDRLLAHLPS